MRQIDISMPITLGIGIGGDAFEVKIVEFGADLEAYAKCLSFVSRMDYVALAEAGGIKLVPNTFNEDSSLLA